MGAGGLFAFLDGASPWWWVAIALALGAVEILTFTYFLLGPASSALTLAAVLFVFPSLSGTLQIALFAVCSVLYAVLGWALMRSVRRRDGTGGPTLNRRGAQMIGRAATVSAAFSAGLGTVTIDGIAWRSRMRGTGADPAAGDVLKVVAVEGATLVVDRPD